VRNLLLTLALAPICLAGETYLVLDACGSKDPYGEAAALLARHHDAERIALDPAAPRNVLPALRRLAPRWVAIVLRPDQLDYNLTRAILQLSTELDADPFVDFSYGYFTGATSEECVRFVRTCIEAKPKETRFLLGRMSGPAPRNVATRRRYPLRERTVDTYVERIFGADGEGHDRNATKRALGVMASCSAVVFVGHGWPKEVVHCCDFEDLKGRRFPGAVVFNVGCYTGVTRDYFEPDWKSGVLVRKSIGFNESFCLSILRSGCVGYTAYTCPRPAGPELDTDLSALLEDGLSLGDARRRDYDKTVLGFLGYGEKRLDLPALREGAKWERASDMVREIMLEYATGGVLFGDPKYVPFPGSKRRSAVGTKLRRGDESILLTASCPAAALFLQCADPTAKFGKTMALRVHARVDLEGRHVRTVKVLELEVRGQRQRTRLLWAIEEDRGRRYCQLKVMFPRGSYGNLEARIKIETTGDAREATRFGGEVVRPKVASKDVTSNVMRHFMLEAAKRHEVSRAALQAALDATAATLRSDPSKNAALQKHGSEGFRALCALLEVGHHHMGTFELLKATYRAGDERHLLALTKLELPNFASISVLEGLGVADTQEVRGLLLFRLLTDNDAGTYTAAARALAHLKDERAVRAIARQLMKFDPGWLGVEAHLVVAVGAIGGERAVAALEAYAVQDKAKQVKAALAQLQRLDPAAANRVRLARTK